MIALISGDEIIIDGTAIPWRWVESSTVHMPPDDVWFCTAIMAWAGYNGFKVPETTWD